MCPSQAVPGSPGRPCDHIQLMTPSISGGPVRARLPSEIHAPYSRLRTWQRMPTDERYANIASPTSLMLGSRGVVRL